MKDREFNEKLVRVTGSVLAVWISQALDDVFKEASLEVCAALNIDGKAAQLIAAQAAVIEREERNPIAGALGAQEDLYEQLGALIVKEVFSGTQPPPYQENRITGRVFVKTVRDLLKAELE